MSVWFLFSLLGALLLTPLHFWSVEHSRLEARFGLEKGKSVGKILGYVSGWGYFIFLFGIWFSPQETYTLPIMDTIVVFSIGWVSISLVNLLLGIIFLLPGFWLGVKGVMDLGITVSETHRADQIISGGLYAKVRHPQYLGALLAHIGISLMIAGFYSLLVTPILIVRDYVVCRKEEIELEREFGIDYIEYKSKVPMLFPYRR
ncbi:MAG: isoprenylcysteine carboxylmethyltransferase family protein [Candidatus Thorarchaeota archaeon]|nr:isoprenylcysteine carboxylmethyltransferase family protein [Candidatus Thorarchaeota archaeon]